MATDSDFARYLDARWSDLVGGLEDEDVAPDVARLAVAETLLASRRSWARRVRDEQVDVSLWAELRERVGLAARPGEAAPHGVRSVDPHDRPAPWLDTAEELRSRRRRRGAGRAAVTLGVVVVLAIGWVWWAARPSTPAVREEANPLPVIWYAAGELHLEEVVVELGAVEEFVAAGAGAVARLGTGVVVAIDAEGAVTELEDSPAELDEAAVPPAYLPPGRYDVRIQSVPLPGGGWVHLIDSSRRGGAQDAVRRSESGRRALVVCTPDLVCEPPRTITEADGSIRLR